MDIQLLDCTLRDGSHVNNGLFGEDNILRIIKALDEANVEIIEAGFLRDNEYTKGSSIYDSLDEFENLMKIQLNSEVSLMIRPDQFNLEKLNRKSNKVDILRFAFHKEDLELTKKYIEKALFLGYKVGVNPVNIASYSNSELKSLVKAFSSLKINSMAIVDTFGVLKKGLFSQICDIFETNLSEEVALGIHLHENLSLSFGLVCDYLNFGNRNRKVIIDSSLLGMGRIPGNLCTELVMFHLLKEYNKNYNIMPILNIISREIEPLKKIKDWGYSPVYLLTAEKGIHRSYGEYLVDNNINYAECNLILDLVKKYNGGQKYDEKLISNLIKEKGL